MLGRETMERTEGYGVTWGYTAGSIRKVSVDMSKAKLRTYTTQTQDTSRRILWHQQLPSLRKDHDTGQSRDILDMGREQSRDTLLT